MFSHWLPGWYNWYEDNSVKRIEHAFCWFVEVVLVDMFPYGSSAQENQGWATAKNPWYGSLVFMARAFSKIFPTDLGSLKMRSPNWHGGSWIRLRYILVQLRWSRLIYPEYILVQLRWSRLIDIFWIYLGPTEMVQPDIFWIYSGPTEMVQPDIYPGPTQLIQAQHVS